MSCHLLPSAYICAFAGASLWMRVGSFLYHSSKIQSLCDQGGEGRSEHTKGFCPPVCRALRCPSMEPGHRFAPRLRRADYSALLGVVRLLVCSPAVYQQPARCFCALSIENTAGRPNAPGDGSTRSVSAAPLTCVSCAWRLRLR